jgi:beta-glucosidase/6-phospho-beta-glucosidase/beta-galactosidase
MALQVKQRYDLPVIVTENGVIFDGDEEAQASFLVRHVRELHRAVEAGVDVRGYFYWSLMDNFEWNHGMGMRFGLLEVSTEPSRARSLRESAKVYRELSRHNGITTAFESRFPPL